MKLTDCENCIKTIFPKMKLTRTFHSVGQGAFYTERFGEDDGKKVFNVVYDCGTSGKRASLNKEIATAFSEEGRIDKNIDLMFISHFHEDHVNGILELENKYDIHEYVIPYCLQNDKELIFCDYLHNLSFTGRLDNPANAFIESLFENTENSNDNEHSDENLLIKKHIVLWIDDTEIVKLPSVYEIWEYIPFCYVRKPLKTIFSELLPRYPDLKNSLTFGSFFTCVRNIFKEKGEITKLRELYKPFYQNDNYYSMTVLSKPICDFVADEAACLYTGDIPLREDSYKKEFVGKYQPYWKDIKTIQSPHHGSYKDNPLDLYNDNVIRDCVICYGESNRYSHPHKTTLMNIAKSNSKIHLVNEDTNSTYQTVFSIEKNNLKTCI